MCWGHQDSLCDPFGTDKPVRPRGFFWYGTSARVVAAGTRHTCALRGDRQVHCYGENVFGQSVPSMPNAECEHDEPVGILKR